MLIYSSLTAACFTFSYPPYYLGFLAPFVFAPFLHFVKEGAPIESALFGAFTGFLVGGGCLYFLAIYKWTVLLFMATVCAIFFAVYAVAINITCRNFPIRALFIAPAIWAVMEWLIHHYPFRLPLSFALSQAGTPPMLKIAAFLGAYGVSFSLLFASSLVVYLIQRKKDLSVKVVIFLVAVLPFVGIASAHAVDRDAKSRKLRLALIQANIPYAALEHTYDNPKYLAQNLETYLEMSRRATKEFRPDIIVWPETAIGGQNVFRFPYYREILFMLAKELGVCLIIGSSDVDEHGNSFNSAFAISKEGKFIDSYNKNLPAPISESQRTPGKEMKVIETPVGKIGILICYETMFPQMAEGLKNKGADLILALSNDSDFQNSAGPYIHAQEIVLRAAENNLYAAQVANTGVTMIVNSQGKIIARIDLNKRGIVVGDIEIPATQPGNTNKGDLFVYANMAGLVVLVLAGVYRKGKRQ